MSPAHRSKLVIELFKHGHTEYDIARALAREARIAPGYEIRYVRTVIAIAKRRGAIPTYTPEPATTG